MNRIEMAAQQASPNTLTSKNVFAGIQPISCTPTVALAATVAALIVTTFGGGYGAGDDVDAGPAGALSSDDLIGTVRAAQSAR